MFKSIFIRRSKMRAQAALVTGDDHAALASGLDIVHTVFDMKTSLVASVPEDIGILVFSNTAKVNNRVRGKEVLFVLESNPGQFTSIIWNFIKKKKKKILTCAPRAVF